MATIFVCRIPVWSWWSVERTFSQCAPCICKCRLYLTAKPLLTAYTGIQAYIYVSQFSGQRSQSHSLRKCSNSWNDASYSALDSLYRHAGSIICCSPISLLTKLCSRSASPWCLHPFSLVRIQLQTLNGSTTCSWSCSKILTKNKRLMSCRCGGTGKKNVPIQKSIPTDVLLGKYSLLTRLRTVFPWGTAHWQEFGRGACVWSPASIHQMHVISLVLIMNSCHKYLCNQCSKIYWLDSYFIGRPGIHM